MRKLDEIKSVDELTFVDYYNYKAMMSMNKKRILGKSEALYLLPLVVGCGCLGLLPISLAFLALSLPILLAGVACAVVAGKSMYVNYCKRNDSKEYAAEYKRLKKTKQLGRVKKLMEEFEDTDRFKQSSLEYEVSKLQSKISYCNTLKENSVYDKSHVDTLRNQLNEKRSMLTKFAAKKPQEENEQELDIM